MPDYHSDLPTSHLLYLNCNSLYTTCQTYLLPVGGFHFLTDAEVLAFDVVSVLAELPTGYFVECDLHYPAKLHVLHNAYLLVTKHGYIVEEMLSNTLRLMQDVTGVTSRATSHTIVAHGLVLDKIPASSRSLSTHTCCRSSNSATAVRKTQSPNSSRCRTN